jgi:lysophospholipase L1-like esterase/enamine deaminase RidA (YjgF/YER057c/UK114 family)
MKYFLILFLILSETAHAAQPEIKLRIVLIGDSPMASVHKPPADRPTLTGWGQAFGEYFSEQVVVRNQADAGTHLKKFDFDGNLKRALREKPDYLVIQFGHGDQTLKDRNGNPATGYRENLRKYVDDVLRTNTTPILVTPVAPRTFVNGKVNSALAKFAEATLAVAREKKVPVVDLHKHSLELFDRLGEAGCAEFGPSKEDRSHFSLYGARTIAHLAVREFPAAVPELKSWVAPRTSQTVSATDGSTAAIVVEGRPLFHSSQVFARNLQHELERIPRRFRPVKLNIVVADDDGAAEARADIQKLYLLDPPCVSIVLGNLANPSARFAVDIVAIGPNDWHRGILKPGPRVYVSGQAEKGATPAEAAKNTLASLLKSLDWLGCKTEDVVQCKSFLKPISAVGEVKKEFEAMFGKDKVPALVFVEWDSTLPIEIELIANAPKPKEENPPPIEYLTPPGMTASPVYCRVARVNAPETIYFSGLYSDRRGTGVEEVDSVFAQLQDALKKSGSDLKHLAKATYYVSGDDSSKQLNLLRPKFYDPKRPPAASKATVSGVGMKDRTLSMDMIAVKKRE